MKKVLLLALLVTGALVARADGSSPVPIAIVGLEHDHAKGMIPRFSGRGDVKLVGIVEANAKLAALYQAEFHLAPELFFPSIDALVAHTRVRAVSVFTPTLGHRAVVEKCAALGIDVMMEKPLATTSEDARAIAEAARKGGIQVIVNYETTWFPNIHAAHEAIFGQHTIGDIRKIVVHDGHMGPAIIGCSPDFLAWLTDPVQNGGGALMDFGCYGADIVAWMMHGQRPLSVVAVTQTFQPDLYPKVDDEGTVVVTYPSAVAILEASWNWPYDRKDVEIYGHKAALMLPDHNSLILRQRRLADAALPVAPLADPNADPLSYLAAVARGDIKPSGLSGLEVNLVAMEILDAARQSAATGRRVELAP